MRQIRVSVKSNNDMWSKSVNVVMTEREIEILKDYDNDEYDTVWDYLVSKLEQMPFPNDDWFVDTINFN